MADKNILYLINHAGAGGTERYVLDLAESYPFGKIFFIYNEPGLLLEKMARFISGSARIAMRKPWDLSAAKKIAAFCIDNAIDLIHTQFMRETYIALTAKKFLKNKRAIKIVCTWHLNDSHNVLWRAVNRFLSGGAERYIAVCETLKATMIKNKLPEGKIIVVFNGVVPSREPDGAYEMRAVFRKKEGIAGNAFVFTTLTRFTPEKGTLFLLKSIQKLKETADRPFVVLVAGDGPMAAELKQAAAEYGVDGLVRFLGYRTDAADILLASDAFLNTSESECLSYAILEAMDHSLPIIATAVGGNVDIVNDTTKCGVTVAYGDTDGLAAAMNNYLNDDAAAKAAGKRAKEAVETKFNAGRFKAETYGIYADVLNDTKVKSTQSKKIKKANECAEDFNVSR